MQFVLILFIFAKVVNIIEKYNFKRLSEKSIRFYSE